MPGTFHNVFGRLQGFAPMFVSTIKPGRAPTPREAV
jgi:hypothetical protein